MSVPAAAPPLLAAPRSGFITALAWILIVVGGFTTLIFGLMVKVMMAFNLVVAIGLVALFVWLIRRLVSPQICGEFAPDRLR
jgi:hypothetical protein